MEFGVTLLLCAGDERCSNWIKYFLYLSLSYLGSGVGVSLRDA